MSDHRDADLGHAGDLAGQVKQDAILGPRPCIADRWRGRVHAAAGALSDQVASA
jgi:hypothetical protein